MIFSFNASRFSRIMLLTLLVLWVRPGGVEAQESNREQEHASDKIMKRAQALAEKGDFGRAVLELIPILDYYPEYTRIDEVFNQLGDYLLELRLFNASKGVFRHLILNNPRSPMVPFAIYGLERLYYQIGEYEQAIEYFHILRKRYPDAQVGDGIFYYAGQSFFFLEDFDNAILTFDAIEEGSEFWGYALYSRALAQFKKKMLMPPSLT